MIITAIKFKGDKCFKDHWSGFDSFKPVNVIIGRNNSGKSRLLKFVGSLCKSETRFKFAPEYLCAHTFSSDSLSALNDNMRYRMNGYWSELEGNLIDKSIEWKQTQQREISDITLSDELSLLFNSHQFHRYQTPFMEKMKEVLPKNTTPFSNKVFRHLLADRDIRIEPASNDMALTDNGFCATNIIRRYLLSTDEKYPRDLIRVDLLQALSTIFGSDASFTEIYVKEHDAERAKGKETAFEVYLGETGKGLIPLSMSGSGLKTILLVLLNLLIIPAIDEKDRAEYIFAFEELENNLHPALFRRLLSFIEAYALKENAVFFLTTHSNVALDMFGSQAHAQIIHVIHDGKTARTQTVSGHLDKLAVVSSLGAKPSDLLQSNGVIWVEGPSDRVYINRWIELFSDGKWKEGRDYQCAFYGGALLAHAQVVADELAVDDLVNLFKINPNVVVVCDSDRTSRTGKGSKLKGRVQRIKSETGKIGDAYCWITEPKEIEHYLSGMMLAKVFEKDKVPDPQPYKPFFPCARMKSYLETELKRKTVDKVELALKVCPLLTREAMSARFDWSNQMEKLVARIARWNAPERRG